MILSAEAAVPGASVPAAAASVAAAARDALADSAGPAPFDRNAESFRPKGLVSGAALFCVNRQITAAGNTGLSYQQGHPPQEKQHAFQPHRILSDQPVR